MAVQPSDEIDSTVVEEIATVLSLSDERTRELCRDLCAAREQLEIRQDIAARPRNTATLRCLARIEKSLARVAREAERARQEDDPHWRAALDAMAHAGELWATTQQREGLEDLGFHPMQSGHHTDFGTDVVIDRWLAMAPVMFELAMRAKEQLRDGDDTTDRRDWPGAMEWLVGKRLPELYEKYSGAPFHLQRDDDRTIIENESTDFVVDALEAMQLEAIKPSTIAWHCGNYGRRIKAD